ncbi:MAG: PQQ-binding-like beta-propeller repeat protein [Actinomycetota bacterium]
MKRVTRSVLAASLVLASIAMAARADVSGCAGTSAGGDWRAYGQDLSNSRNQPAEHTIGTATVSNLKPALWHVDGSLLGGGSFSNTPLVADGCLYVATGSGTVASFNADSGILNWKRSFSGNGSTLAANTITGSPAVGGGRVFAAIGNSNAPTMGGWSYDVAVWQDTGLPAWPNETGWGATTGDTGTVLDTTPGAFVASSPVWYNPDPVHYPDGLVFQGFMAGEATATARGGWDIINATDGSIVKKSYTISADDYTAGHRGASVWSTAAVDTATNYIYVGTGNPASKDEDANANAIIKIDGDPARAATFGTLAGSYHGLPDNYATAVDLYDQAVCQNTGSVRVVWGQTCGQQDLDFGAAPNLITLGGHTFVGDLQKAGVYHLVDTATMRSVWTTIVGTPEFQSNANSASVENGQIFTAASSPNEIWSLNASGGERRWTSPLLDGAGFHYNEVSTANGVVYTGDSTGTLRALDEATGLPLWASPASRVLNAPTEDFSNSSGVAIARNKVYWAVAGFILVYQL